MKKSKIRIYITKKISSNLLVYIKDKQHHYLKNVMRVKINDKITIFDGITGEWVSLVLSLNRNNTVLRIIKKTKNIIDGPDLWIIFSPIKHHRMALVVQKATELGVSKIIPCLTEYTNIKSVNINSLKMNAIEAAEQSERLNIPSIDNTVTLESLMSSWPEDRYIIFCDETLKQEKNMIESLMFLKNKTKKLAVVIGPEGGFSNYEKKLITNRKNVLAVSLGQTLLRSDTATIVSLFCVKEILS